MKTFFCTAVIVLLSISIAAESTTRLPVAEDSVTTESMTIKPGVRMIEADGYYVYGETILTETEYVTFLKERCPIAYSQWKEGNDLFHMGKGMLIWGLAFLVPSIAFNTLGLILGVSDFCFMGLPFEICSAALGLACIPVWIVGVVRRGRAIDTFNSVYAKPPISMSLELNINSNGVGLALRF